LLDNRQASAALRVWVVDRLVICDARISRHLAEHLVVADIFCHGNQLRVTSS